MTQRFREDYVTHFQVTTYHERCPCGAEFTVSLTYDAGKVVTDLREREASSEYRLWQGEHALVCNTMLRAIEPRRERVREFHEKLAQEAAERKRKAQESQARSRARKQAVA